MAKASTRVHAITVDLRHLSRSESADSHRAHLDQTIRNDHSELAQGIQLESSSVRD